MPVDFAKIRQLREARGLTQAQAATAAGFDVRPELARQVWYTIEAGRRPNVTIDTLERVAHVLGVTASDLLTPFRGAPAPRPSRPK